MQLHTHSIVLPIASEFDCKINCYLLVNFNYHKVHVGQILPSLIKRVPADLHTKTWFGPYELEELLRYLKFKTFRSIELVSYRQIKTEFTHYKTGSDFLKKMDFLEKKESLEIVEQLPLCNARSLRGSYYKGQARKPVVCEIKNENFIFNCALLTLSFYTEVRNGSKNKDNDVTCISGDVLGPGRINALLDIRILG